MTADLMTEQVAQPKQAPPMSNVKLAWLVLTSPKEAFAYLREHPRFWFPLLLLILGHIAVALWYLAVVDRAWLVESILPSDANNPQAQETRDVAGAISGMILFLTAFGPVFDLVIFRTLDAVYYFLVANATNIRSTFTHWLALSCWSSLPRIALFIAPAIALLVADDGQISKGDLQFFSLNDVFFHLQSNEPLFALTSRLTILHPLVWLLSIIGMRELSGRSVVFASTVVLLPWLCIYGVRVITAFV